MNPRGIVQHEIRDVQPVNRYPLGVSQVTHNRLTLPPVERRWQRVHLLVAGALLVAGFAAGAAAVHFFGWL